jgi:hypothetical protein
MTAAWAIKVDGETPIDNHPDPIKRTRNDKAIWGHVKGAASPLIDIEFWSAFQAERVISSGLKNSDIAPVVVQKDWLINLLTARMCLDEVEGIGSRAYFDMWHSPRPLGLGWISKKRIEEYRRLA